MKYCLSILFFLLFTIGFSQSEILSCDLLDKDLNNTIKIDAINLNLIAKGVIKKTNEIREKHGLEILSESSLLSDAARTHSNQMAKHSFFNHVNPYNSPLQSLSHRLDYVSYPYKLAGENIYSSYISDEENLTYNDLSKNIVQTLYKSRSHKKNIINPNYQEIGVGVVLSNEKKANYIYFYLTQDFGTKL